MLIRPPRDFLSWVLCLSHPNCLSLIIFVFLVPPSLVLLALLIFINAQWSFHPIFSLPVVTPVPTLLFPIMDFLFWSLLTLWVFRIGESMLSQISRLWRDPRRSRRTSLLRYTQTQETPAQRAEPWTKKGLQFLYRRSKELVYLLLQNWWVVSLQRPNKGSTAGTLLLLSTSQQRE